MRLLYNMHDFFDKSVTKTNLRESKNESKNYAYILCLCTHTSYRNVMFMSFCIIHEFSLCLL